MASSFLTVALLLFGAYVSFAFKLNPAKGSLHRHVVEASKLYAGFGKIETEFGKDKDSKSLIQLTKGNCLCGSGNPFSACCEPHIMNEGRDSSPKELILSRYTAYRSENLDYIIKTSSKTNPDYNRNLETSPSFEKAMRNWKRNIKKTMITGYAFVKMEIDSVEEETDDGMTCIVNWRHLAIGEEENIMYPVQEKSTLVRDEANGPWKYEGGHVTRPTSEDSKVMMHDWPAEMGYVQKVKTPEQMALAQAKAPPVQAPVPQSRG